MYQEWQKSGIQEICCLLPCTPGKKIVWVCLHAPKARANATISLDIWPWGHCVYRKATYAFNGAAWYVTHKVATRKLTFTITVTDWLYNLDYMSTRQEKGKQVKLMQSNETDETCFKMMLQHLRWMIMKQKTVKMFLLGCLLPGKILTYCLMSC